MACEWPFCGHEGCGECQTWDEAQAKQWEAWKKFRRSKRG